jgi:MSHA pilin protein MshD
MCTSRPSRQRGVTLIEMIFFILIVSVAMAGLIQVFNMTARDSADPVRDKQALMIAESLLEEVQLSGFTYCDPTSDNATTAASWAACTIREQFGQGTGGEPVQTRPFDNVNDYAGAPGVETEAFLTAGLLSDANGQTMNVSGYRAWLTVTPAVLNGIGVANGSPNTDVLHIKIRVSYEGQGGAQSLVLDGYRTRYAPTFQ